MWIKENYLEETTFKEVLVYNIKRLKNKAED